MRLRRAAPWFILGSIFILISLCGGCTSLLGLGGGSSSPVWNSGSDPTFSNPLPDSSTEDDSDSFWNWDNGDTGSWDSGSDSGSWEWDSSDSGDSGSDSGSWDWGGSDSDSWDSGGWDSSDSGSWDSGGWDSGGWDSGGSDSGSW